MVESKDLALSPEISRMCRSSDVRLGLKRRTACTAACKHPHTHSSQAHKIILELETNF